MVGPILSAKNKGPLNENVIKRFYFVYLKVRNYFYVIKTLAPYRPKQLQVHMSNVTYLS